MNFQPWLEFIAMLLGSIVGAYLAVRVTLARLEERVTAQGEKIADYGKRIERLEGEYFRAD